MTWDDLESGDVVFPYGFDHGVDDSWPWVVISTGRDEHGVPCLAYLNLGTSEVDECESGGSRFNSGVRVWRRGELVHR